MVSLKSRKSRKKQDSNSRFSSYKNVTRSGDVTINVSFPSPQHVIAPTIHSFIPSIFIAFFFLLVMQSMISYVNAAVIKWQIPTSETYTPLLVDESNVYLFTADGSVYAFNRFSGSRQWSLKINGTPTADAILVKDTLYVPTSTGLYAIGIDGRSVDVFQTDNALTTSPMFAENTLIAISYNGTMYIFDATKQLSKTSLLRTVTLGEKTTGSAVISGGKVYVILQDGRVLSVDPFTGTKIGLSSLNMSVPHASPCVVNNTLIFAAENSLFALTLAGARIGAVAWQADFNTWINNIVCDDETLYVGSNDGAIYIVDATTGTPTAKYQTSDAIRYKPVITAHTLYVASNDNNLYALEHSNISVQKWNITFEDWPTTPQYRKGMLYTVTVNGVVNGISTLDCNISLPQEGDKVAAEVEMKGKAHADAAIAKIEVRTVPGDWTAVTVDGAGFSKGNWTASLPVKGFGEGNVPLQCRVTDVEGNVEIQPYDEVTADYVFSFDRLPTITAKYPQRIEAGKKFTIEFFKDENTTLSGVEVEYGNNIYVSDDDGKITITSPVTEGKITLEARAPNYQPLTISIDVGKSPVTLLLYAVIAIVFIVIVVYIFIRSRTWR